MIDRNTSGVFIPIPLSEDKIFRNQAMDDILELLYRNPHDEFGIRELRDITGHGGQTVDDAIEKFSKLRLIQTRREGNKKLVSINRKRIQKVNDPIMRIPQDEFRKPVKALLEELKEKRDNLVGVLIFGSVARGKADRASDIDVLVIVEDGLLNSRRQIQDIRQKIEEKRFEGNRYTFQVMVEAVETAKDYGEKLSEIFSEAIVIVETDKLQEVKRGILHG